MLTSIQPARCGLKSCLSAWKPCGLIGESALADFHELRKGLRSVPRQSCTYQNFDTNPACLKISATCSCEISSPASSKRRGLFRGTINANDLLRKAVFCLNGIFPEWSTHHAQAYGVHPRWVRGNSRWNIDAPLCFLVGFDLRVNFLAMIALVCPGIRKVFCA